MTLSEIIAIDCICLPSGTVLRGEEASQFVAKHGHERVLWSDNFNAFIDTNGAFNVKVATPQSQEHEIEFEGFIEVRAERGAKAAKYTVDGSWLWMDRRDIELNIGTIGNHPELIKGLEAYEKWTADQTSVKKTLEPTLNSHSSPALA